MASGADHHPRGRRLGAAGAAAFATAVLVWFATGLHPWWPLLWLAPLPVLVLAPRAAWWSAALVAALGWFAGGLNTWHYLHGALDLPAAVLAQFYGVDALVFAAAVLLYRALVRRGAVASAIVGFAAMRVAAELVINATSPHGTAGNLAYTQLAATPFLQLASLTGPWGMTFVVLAVPAAVAAAWHVRGTRRARWVIGAAAGVLAAVLAFGALRLASGPSGPRVTVGLVASDPPSSPDVADEGAPAAALLRAYADQADALAARGARLIVLPEKLAVVTDGSADAAFQAVADRAGATIVVGVIQAGRGGARATNDARVYAPGRPVQRYAKRHLLPPFESRFAPGDALAVVPQPLATLGVAICKDMDFTPLSRAYGRAGAGLMLVPAWDFTLDRLWHGHMAVMRGVESGFGVVRAAKQGYLTVSDNRGRILAETTSDAAPFATLIADVRTSHDDTLYLRAGDWFAWLALAGLAGAVAQLIRMRRA